MSLRFRRTGSLDPQEAREPVKPTVVNFFYLFSAIKTYPLQSRSQAEQFLRPRRSKVTACLRREECDKLGLYNRSKS